MYHIDLKKDKPNIMKMLSTMQGIMHRGIRIADCKKIRDYYVNLRSVLKNNFVEQYGIDNPNSTKQVSRYIEELSFKVNPEGRNEILDICYDENKEKWTTDAKAMEALSGLGYEFAQDLLDYRHAKKYADTLESIMEFADENSLIHPEVSLAKTNRLNYSKPGLMSVPKKLLWNVVAPYKSDCILYSVDIKNQEPSILINMTGAEELKYAIQSQEGLYETIYRQCFEPKVTANILVDTLNENRQYSYSELRDMGIVSPAMYTAVKPMISGYVYNGKRITEIETICIGSTCGEYPKLPDTATVEFDDGSIEDIKVEWESADGKYTKDKDYTLQGKLIGVDITISKQERAEFKRSYLAISYGSSIMGIEKMCKLIDGKQVYRYITGISAIKEYRKKIKAYAKTGATSIRTIFGTPVYTDEPYNERVLLDLPIQGSGADILSLLIEHFFEYIRNNGLVEKLDICFTRHDELIIEVNKQWADEVGDTKMEQLLRDIFEHQIDDWEPFKVEVSRLQASELDISIEDD